MNRVRRQVGRLDRKAFLSAFDDTLGGQQRVHPSTKHFRPLIFLGSGQSEMVFLLLGDEADAGKHPRLYVPDLGLMATTHNEAILMNLEDAPSSRETEVVNQDVRAKQGIVTSRAQFYPLDEARMRDPDQRRRKPSPPGRTTRKGPPQAPVLK
ncbi:hypothetical protein BDZ89DRAFT_1035228 [Hymenopellis radicata]|nr:hypothetical protein BDZ89DRAFT_1035228 [Hymenopellis radicata]